MAYSGKRRGSRKAMGTVRIAHLTGNVAQLSVNGGSMGSSLPLSTSQYFQIYATTSGTTNLVEVFSDTGEILELATGAPGSEVPLLQIPPGGEVPNYIRIEAGVRLSIRAISANPVANTTTMINFFD
jgi:hypothetical protein